VTQRHQKWLLGLAQASEHAVVRLYLQVRNMNKTMSSDLPDASWRKATASQADGACVEVANIGQKLAARDSKLGRDSAVLLFSGRGWNAFLARVKSGRFERT
jgi:hypothetical protein